MSDQTPVGGPPPAPPTPPIGPPPAPPTPPASAPPPGPPPPPPSDAAATPARRRGIGSLIVAVALIAAAAGGAFVLSQGDDDDDGAVTAAGEILLEPVAFRSADPFTTTVDVHNASASSTTIPVLPTIAVATTNASTPTTVATVRSVRGSTPGLYGGTRDNGACDADQLITFLGDNPAKATAWAGVIGITAASIPDYVRSLTPVVLQRDTRVTNHGFRNGRATSLQSVLQAGTAVLVDDLGVPRVKCGCGNPLGEPTAVAGSVTYTGTPWPSFAPSSVVVVAPAPAPMPTIILVDVAGGEPFTRPTGTAGTSDELVTADSLCDLYPEDEQCGAPSDVVVDDEPVLGTGDVQITLRWSSTADLDLAVTDPTGARIDYNAPSSPSGGQLDVDSNGGCDATTSTPVENIFWPVGAGPDGVYTIEVSYFDTCSGGEGPQSFTLSFSLGGVETTVLPVRFEGEHGMLLAVQRDGTVSLAASAVARSTVVEDTLAPGETRQFSAGKGPGYQGPPADVPPVDETPVEPPVEPPDDETPVDETPVDETPVAPVAPDCSQYEEGTPMRILCEHDPTTNDVSGEDAGSLPAPAP